MSEITRQQVDHIAKLSRIRLTEDEEEKMASEMGAILSYIDKLKAVDTEGVEPIAHATGLENVMRADLPNIHHRPGQYSEELLHQAPEKDKNFLKVRTVLERE